MRSAWGPPFGAVSGTYDADVSLPLDGVRVVALEQAVAAPLCTRHLADLGADVIKVERPEGDFARRYDSVVKGQSAYFVWLNRGKRSIALDVTTDRGTFDALLARADLLVHNLGPGAIDRLGYGWEAAHARWPRLIWVGISGFGVEGPYRERKSYDLLVQCESGVISVTGTEADPVKVGISIADISGGMYALASTLAALRQRDRDGAGRRVDISLFECLAEWMGSPAYTQMYTGAPPPRTGMRHSTIAPYGPYRCADGHVTLAVQNEKQWAALCDVVLDRPELAADPRFATNELRSRNRRELEAIVEEVFASATGRDIEAKLDAADVPFASLSSVADLVAHPQLAARWTEVASPGGPIRALRPPFGMEARMAAVPALNEHAEEIRRELAR
ncbi:MAG: CoA transferase [Chloroflexi bacterium]|nr:CoA transferase [Chloroflexota bacterium]